MFTGLIFGFIYFSTSKSLLILIAVSLGVTVYRRLDYSFYLIAFLTPLLVRAPDFLGTSNFSVAELVVLVVLCVWMLRKAVWCDFSWIHSRLDIPLLVFFSLTLVSALGPLGKIMFPVYYFESFSQLYPLKVVVNTFEVVFLYFFVTNNFREKYLRGLVGALAAGLVFASFVGVIQYFQFISEFPMERWFKEYDPFVVTSTLNHKNFFGMYLILLIPLTYYLTYFYSGIHKLAYFFTAGISTLALIVSHSRGAIIGLLAAILLTSVFKSRRALTQIFLVLTITAIILASTPQFMETSFAERFKASGKDMDARSDCFGKTFSTLKSKPMGIGAGTFREKQVCHYGNNEWSITFHHAHNLYLQIMVERGWLALAAFITAMMIFFRISYLSRLGEELTSKTIIGLSTGLLAVLIHGFFDYPFYSQRIALLFFFLMGIAVSLDKNAFLDVA